MSNQVFEIINSGIGVYGDGGQTLSPLNLLQLNKGDAGIQGAGAGLSLDNDNNVRLGDDVGVFYSSPSTPISNDAYFEVNGSLFSNKLVGGVNSYFAVDVNAGNPYSSIGLSKESFSGGLSGSISTSGSIQSLSTGRSTSGSSGTTLISGQTTPTGEPVVQVRANWTQGVTNFYSAIEIGPFSASEGNITIRDEGLNKGAVYASDYSANFTNRSLIDKGYLLGVVANYYTKAESDSRYHLKQSILSNSNVFSYLGNVTGIQVGAYAIGSNGLPNYAGSAITIYTGSNNVASAMGRVISLFRSYNSENFYLGSSNAGGSTNPWRLIWHSGNLTPVTTNTNQVITGVKNIRIGATSERLVFAWDYPDNDGNDYHLRLYNNGASNNIRYYFKQKVILGVNNVVLDLPVLGFKNGVSMIGIDNLPFTEVETYYNSQTNPATRHPLNLYVNGDTMIKGRVYAGKGNYLDTLFLDSGDAFYSEGTVYAKGGLRTPSPSNPLTLDHTTWKLGSATADATGSHTTKLRVSIDGTEYDILAQTVVV